MTARSVHPALCCLAVGLAAWGAWAEESAADHDLNGLWTVYVQGRETPLVIEINQTQDGSLHAKYAQIPPNSRGVQPGFDFCSAKIEGHRGTGKMVLRTAQDGSKIEAGLTLDVADDGDTIHCKIEPEKLRPEDPPIFDLVRRPLCPVLRGVIELRTSPPTALTLAEDLLPLDPAEDQASREGMCHYFGAGVGSLTVRTQGIEGGDGAFALAVPLPACDIDIYREESTDTGPEPIKTVLVSWSDHGTGGPNVFERWGVSFLVSSFTATFERADDGSVSFTQASIEIRARAVGDVHLGGQVWLTGDLTGAIRYTWNDGANSWTDGQWSFAGLGDLELQVRRGQRDAIATAVLRLDPSGQVTGRFGLTSLRHWRFAGMALTLDHCSLEVVIDIRTNTWQVLRGGILGNVTVGEPFEGAFDFLLRWSGRTVEMQIDSGSDISIFGGDLLELAVHVDFVPQTFEFTRIEGRVAYKHPELDANLSVASFLVERGALSRFTGSGEVAYRGFTLSLQRIEYLGSGAGARLEVSRGSLNLGWSRVGGGAVELTNLSIDARGTISSFEIRGAIVGAPVDIRFVATFSGREFSGTFDGTFGGDVEIGGRIVIGARQAPNRFSHGYLQIQLELPEGVSIGPGGLELLGLTGAFGCNYVPDGAPVSLDSGPKLGCFYLQAVMTIGDVAGFAKLRGTVSMELGRSNPIQLRGRLQVTRDTPFVAGELVSSYQLGSSDLSGVVRASVRIPASGSVLSIASSELTYQVHARDWHLSGQDLGGTLFGFLSLVGGRLDLGGRLRSPASTMRGQIDARLRGRKRVAFAWPERFSPWGNGSGGSCQQVRTAGLQLDCKCVLDTDHPVAGVGFLGALDFRIGGRLQASLDATGTRGAFSVHATLAGVGVVTLPWSGYFQSPCARSMAVWAQGDLTARNRNGRLVVRGTVTLIDGGGNELIDVEIDQTL